MRDRITRRLLDSEKARADGWVYDTETRGLVARYQGGARSRCGRRRAHGEALSADVGQRIADALDRRSTDGRRGAPVAGSNRRG